MRKSDWLLVSVLCSALGMAQVAAAQSRERLPVQRADERARSAQMDRREDSPARSRAQRLEPRDDRSRVRVDKARAAPARDKRQKYGRR